MLLGVDLHLALLGRLLLAAGLGGAIGLERELGGKPAGFRTNLLICVGAALLTDLSFSIAASATPGVMTSDPARLTAQIVSGIGFLGAGTILQSRGSITGLTTAATLWVAAAIGIAVGSGEFVVAIGATVLVILALRVLVVGELVLRRRRVMETVRVVVDPAPEPLHRVRDILEAAGFRVTTEEVRKERDGYTAVVQISGWRTPLEGALQLLVEETGVRSVRTV